MGKIDFLINIVFFNMDIDQLDNKQLQLKIIAAEEQLEKMRHNDELISILEGVAEMCDLLEIYCVSSHDENLFPQKS